MEIHRRTEVRGVVEAINNLKVSEQLTLQDSQTINGRRDSWIANRDKRLTEIVDDPRSDDIKRIHRCTIQAEQNRSLSKQKREAYVMQ